MKRSFFTLLSAVLYKWIPVACIAILAACSAASQVGKSGPPEMLWDMQQLKQAPAFSWVKTDSIVASLVYNSVSYDGRPTKVFAYYSNPDVIAGRPASGKKFPGVVLIHGGGGRAFPQWVAKWAREGYAAIAMDLAGKDGYGNPLPDGGPDQSNENKIMNFSSADVKKAWSYHAVASVILAHSLLLNLGEVEKSKTCVTGISWGGYLTCMAAGLDSRFKAAVPVYGCGYLGESDIFKNQLGRLSESEQNSWLSYYDPSMYLGAATMPILFLNGNKDKHYNVVPLHRTYSLIPAAQRFVCIKPDMKHSHPAGWESMEIALFFKKILEGDKGLPQVVSVSTDQGIIRVTYAPEPTVVKAMLYYSNDDQSLNEQRKWMSAEAPIDDNSKTATVKVPEPYKYAFVQLTAANGAAISTEFIIPSLKK